MRRTRHITQSGFCVRHSASCVQKGRPPWPRNIVQKKQASFCIGCATLPRHVMAEAVLGVYPDAKIAIGPAIDTGFYYDFDLGADEQGRPRTFSPEDLAEIEKRMRQIVAGKYPFAYREVSADEARQLFEGQPYKLELIDGLAKGGIDEYGNESAGPVVIGTYRHDTFEDLCRGPHLDHTGQIPPDAFKLMTVAGAYWRGDETSPMLQRIYGTAWRNEEGAGAVPPDARGGEEARPSQAGQRARDLPFDDEVGQACRSGCPTAAIMIEEFEKLAKEMEFKAGYQRVSHAAPRQGRSLPPQRPPALLRRKHVSADGAGGRCATTSSR